MATEQQLRTSRRLKNLKLVYLEAGSKYMNSVEDDNGDPWIDEQLLDSVPWMVRWDGASHIFV
jgi:hypothetical protein